MSEQTNTTPAADPAAGGAPGQELPATDGAPEPAPAAAPEPGAGAAAPDGPEPAAETTIPAGDAASAQAAAEQQAEQAGADEPDYKDLYLRARADMENVRKRARRDVGAAEARGIAKLAKELLPALDDLERALQAAPEDDPMRAGVKIVHERLLASLAKLGIEADAPEGETFDPHRHEAIAQQPVEGAASGTIVQVYSNGYLLGERLLRPAMVAVADPQ